MDQGDRPARKRRVKSGCQTCRIRKAKCDEGYPACHRCLSTGRHCDGYGIWGGGKSYRSSEPSPLTITQPSYHPQQAASKQEGPYLDWFQHRSITRLPGSFVSAFWSSFLLQSSVAEPAVLHAILALSSVHRQGIMDDDHPGAGRDEKFTLESYSRAIRHSPIS
ncbi:hypothetical protein BDV59DRAFT_185714 [Aspergillus ambiguus]|uniref:Zn(II)2Cys6 transcription factor n=1 Tax=Aspergillus ambiguus TaxID=176160 RepID=UPI003CCD2C9F